LFEERRGDPERGPHPMRCPQRLSVVRDASGTASRPSGTTSCPVPPAWRPISRRRATARPRRRGAVAVGKQREVKCGWYGCTCRRSAGRSRRSGREDRESRFSYLSLSSVTFVCIDHDAPKNPHRRYVIPTAVGVSPNTAAPPPKRVRIGVRNDEQRVFGSVFNSK
jgi:hypothetical protein